MVDRLWIQLFALARMRCAAVFVAALRCLAHSDADQFFLDHSNDSIKVYEINSIYRLPIGLTFRLIYRPRTACTAKNAFSGTVTEERTDRYFALRDIYE